jgi:hypothetical protein
MFRVCITNKCLSGGGINSIYQIDISCRSHRPQEQRSKYMVAENKYFDDLVVLCGEINFSMLALWIFHLSGGCEILVGVMAVVAPVGQGQPNKPQQCGRSKVVLNPGPDIVLGACDALFVMGSSRTVVTETLKSILERFLLGEELPFMRGHEYPPSSSSSPGGRGGSRNMDSGLGFGGEWAETMREDEKGG